DHPTDQRETEAARSATRHLGVDGRKSLATP
ncbi:hypothetical protein scyTo_0021720, partial [Scyliorhinus torazame]|nr:hypothetical protein [Scyliorhinus torazame]